MNKQHIVTFHLLKRTIKIMKLILIMLVAALSQIVAGTYAQTTTVSIHANNERLETVLKKIEKDTEFLFFYRTDEVDKNERISIEKNDSNIKEILDEIAVKTGITYSIKDRHIVLRTQSEISAAPGVSQQSGKRISGNVTDERGEPVIGANVVEKGTTNGVVTDIDGNFSFTVNENATLMISYVGMKPQELIAMSSPMQIILMEDANLLNEVVVVGYGTMERKAVTSSITSLSSKDLVQGIGGASIATALQGKVAGLVISGTASPNSSNILQLRGVGSINAGKEPLVVIDGIPGGDMRSVNQEDITSIDVLKDASAGAIYGTRAAAGVILITTRQGSAENDGKVKLTYTGEFTTESIRKKPEVLSAEEYLKYGKGVDYGGNSDWYDELVRDLPFSHRQVFGVNGGSRHANIFASFTVQDQKGIVINDSRKDYSARVNTNLKFFDDFFEIKTHAAYRQANRTDHRPNFNQAIKANPTRPVYNQEDPSGTGYNIWLGGWEDFNALAESNLSNNRGTDKWLNGDATFKLNLLPELTAQATIGYQNWQNEGKEYRSRWTKEEQEARRTGRAKMGFEKREDYSFDTYANYIKDFNGHALNATAGYSFFETNREYWNMENFNFPVDAIDVWDMKSGTFLSDGSAVMDSGKDARERLMAFFARANYSYKDKYMITASIRHEGSSKFGKNNRWGNFWAVSGGWRISEEYFMENVSFVNDLKLRVGYGITGNNGFEAGKSVMMYKSDEWWLINSDWIKTFGSSHNVNENLKWEEKKEINFGLDYSLFNNRLYGKLDIYKRKVDGMLYSIKVPQPPYVYDNMIANAGNLENKGWEFEIGGDVVRNKEFTYSTSIRLSNNKSKILSLWGSNTFEDRFNFPGPGMPGYGIRLQEGSTIGKFYLWRFAGFDDNGEWLLYDKDNNVIPAKDKKAEDKDFVGNSIPKLMVSWDHSFTYKEWDLSIFLRSWIKFDVFNAVDMYYGLSNVAEINVLKDAYHKYAHIKGEKQLTDFWLDDGTFLKIDAINLGYRLNLKKYFKYLDNARFYLTVRDVATFTGYKGLNPEVNINGLDPGFEMHNSIYPQTRRYTLGLQLTF